MSLRFSIRMLVLLCNIEVIHWAAAFRLMLQYLYCGNLATDDPDLVMELLSLADEYLLSHLKELCSSFLLKAMSSRWFHEGYSHSSRRQCGTAANTRRQTSGISVEVMVHELHLGQFGGLLSVPKIQWGSEVTRPTSWAVGCSWWATLQWSWYKTEALWTMQLPRWSKTCGHKSSNFLVYQAVMFFAGSLDVYRYWKSQAIHNLAWA